MFIRESRKNVKGVTYTYYKLVESFRNENGIPTNRTILDLSSEDLDGIKAEEFGVLARLSHLPLKSVEKFTCAKFLNTTDLHYYTF